MKSNMRMWLTVMSAWLTTMVMAGPVTMENARKNAMAYLAASHGKRAAANQPMKLAFTIDRTTKRVVKAQPMLYAFQIEGGQGLVIASADDVAWPVLGYCEADSVTLDNMPSNMRAWLEGYANEIAWAQENGYKPVEAQTVRKAGRVDVPYMVKTIWDQVSPYNNQCKFNRVACLTGCVATAMAQIMGYWGTIGRDGEPFQHGCTSLESYITDSKGYTVPALDAVESFDWKNMSKVPSTTAQKAAVSQLMRYCGQSVFMDYTNSSSGAFSDAIPKAFRKNFGYDNGVQLIYRDYMTAEEWDEIMYAEMLAGRPVCMGGVDAKEGAGHEFICDGYKASSGKYHFNWGWNGFCDGEFSLEALVPGGTGSGGTTSNQGNYSSERDAVIGIQPPQPGSSTIAYTKEKGVLFVGMDKSGSNYQQPVLAYPPFYQPEFINMTGTADVHWTLNGENCDDKVDPETGNLPYNDLPRSTYDGNELFIYNTPVISNETTSFSYYQTFADGSENPDVAGLVAVRQPDFPMAYTYVDTYTNLLYSSGVITSSTGSVDYLFGTGKADLGSKYTSIGVAQAFPAPVKPFTANEISIRTISNSKPIASGKSLTMELRNVVNYSSGKSYGETKYETLVATSADVSVAWTYSDGTKVYNVCFHKQGTDSNGQKANVPVVLDKDFCLVVKGLNGKGIDCGFMGWSVSEDDIENDHVFAAVPLISTYYGESSFNYSEPLSLAVDFWGYFDVVKVPEPNNQLHVSADGMTVTNSAAPAELGDAAPVIVSRDWFDADGNDNYELEAPGWVKDITVTPTETTEEDGCYLLSIQADPLPDGVESRTGKIYVLGSGVRSELPVIVVQDRQVTGLMGDVNIDGIVDVTDVMLIVGHILGNDPEDYHHAFADMNDDGIVDVTDVMLVVNYILNYP
jgi:hypothetical protein